jgi:hypothetical protein
VPDAKGDSLQDAFRLFQELHQRVTQLRVFKKTAKNDLAMGMLRAEFHEGKMSARGLL